MEKYGEAGLFGSSADINLSTSSKLTNPSRTYTIFEVDGTFNKFGVTDAALKRYNDVLREVGPGVYGHYTDIVPKNTAHF